MAFNPIKTAWAWGSKLGNAGNKATSKVVVTTAKTAGGVLGAPLAFVGGVFKKPLAIVGIGAGLLALTQIIGGKERKRNRFDPNDVHPEDQLNSQPLPNLGMMSPQFQPGADTLMGQQLVTDGPIANRVRGGAPMRAPIAPEVIADAQDINSATPARN